MQPGTREVTLMKNVRSRPSGIVLTLALVVAFSVAVGPSLADDPEKNKPEESKQAESKSAPPAKKPAEQAEAPSVDSRAVKKPPKEAEVYVFTNADLQPSEGALTESRIDDPAPSANPAPSAAPAPSDPLTWLQDQQKARVDRQQRIEAAEREVEAAGRQVANLEKQSFAVRNPFGARPDLDEEEKQQRAVEREKTKSGAGGETATQRLERTQQMLAEARQRLQAAEQELAAARAGR